MKDIKSELLQAWEDTYKKGQLTFWVFLSLRDGPKYVNDIKDFIRKYTNDTIVCEEQSLYRSLRKFSHLEMVTFKTEKGNKGPDRKYYELTRIGEELLDAFIDRNIKLFFNDHLIQLLNIKF